MNRATARLKKISRAVVVSKLSLRKRKFFIKVFIFKKPCAIIILNSNDLFFKCKKNINILMIFESLKNYT